MIKNREIRNGKEVIAEYDDSGKYITDSGQQEIELLQKIEDVKTKREKYKLSGTQEDFQNAVLADMDAIKAKLGI